MPKFVFTDEFQTAVAAAYPADHLIHKLLVNAKMSDDIFTLMFKDIDLILKRLPEHLVPDVDLLKLTQEGKHAVVEWQLSQRVAYYAVKSLHDFGRSWRGSACATAA